ncbi:MAG: pyridoxal 5'-phosphate synthase [Alphaproteobacteria bacterium]|nr:pyridoxal 5'-phosphate synthase [Alphaproteobacteria bacterium]
MQLNHQNLKTFDTLTGDSSLTGDSGFSNPPSEPLGLLNKWLETANRLKVREPLGMTLATVDPLGRPSTRVVLLKGITEKGLIFSTREESTKGQNLETNPLASGTLWWRETIQQINFQGCVSKLSKEISDAAFKERPRDAKAIAAISKQSAPLSDEKALRDEVNRLIATNDEITRPKGWHAYILEPTSIEFWQGSPDRFHKRLRYDLANGEWKFQRLQP